MRSANELVADHYHSETSSVSLTMLTENWVRASFQIICNAGDLNGTFKVRGSNDLPVGVPPNQFNPTNWNTIGSAQTLVCSITAASAVLIPAFDTCYHWHQVQFTAGNGGAALGSFSIRAESRAF